MRFKIRYIEGYHNGYDYCGFSKLRQYIKLWIKEVKNG